MKAKTKELTYLANVFPHCIKQTAGKKICGWKLDWKQNQSQSQGERFSAILVTKDVSLATKLLR